MLGAAAPSKVAACSVSKVRRDNLFTALDNAAPGRLYVARTAYDIPIDIRYGTPETIGVDRLLASVAAYRRTGRECVVVDAGTAVTVDAVNHEGVFLGGYIFPGLALLSGALTGRTDLPPVEPASLCAGIGHSTVTCLSHAATTGFSGAVAELVRRAREEAGSLADVVLTGGEGELLDTCLPFGTILVPDLTLEGLGWSLDVLPPYRENEKIP
jgi:type III pantothenate kinase